MEFKLTNPSSKKTPLSQGERSARRRQRYMDQGLKRAEVWVRPQDVPLVQFIAGRIRNGAVVSISPVSGQTEPEDTMQQSEIADMTTKPWNVETLKTALDASEELLPDEFICTVSEGADPVLEVTVSQAGDLKLLVAISGETITTQTLLWPRDEQEDATAFEGMMLRSHKTYLPLASLGITMAEGREYYELFGSMSSRSVLSSVVNEFRTIANNAIDLAKELRPAAAEAA